MKQGTYKDNILFPDHSGSGNRWFWKARDVLNQLRKSVPTRGTSFNPILLSMGSPSKCLAFTICDLVL